MSVLKPPFEVEASTSEGGAAVIAVHGEVDIATAADLAQRLAAAVDSGAQQLVIDLTDVSFIDCAGVRPIASIRGRLPQESCQVVLRRPPPLARKVIELFDLDGPCVIED